MTEELIVPAFLHLIPIRDDTAFHRILPNQKTLLPQALSPTYRSWPWPPTGGFLGRPAMDVNMLF
jgi:hypothetical protein